MVMSLNKPICYKVYNAIDVFSQASEKRRLSFSDHAGSYRLYRNVGNELPL